MNRSKTDVEQFPWSTLTAPESGYVTILANPENKWPFFWGRKKGDGPALILRTKAQVSVKGRDVRGMAVESQRDGGEYILSITLENELDSDVFQYFCQRLLEICAGASTEDEVVSTVLREIERWHEFLGRLRSGLTLEQRMGLFAELHFLRKSIGERGGAVALGAWRGPEGASQDFVFEDTMVEVKATPKGATHVRISSEFQLDVPSDTQLFLYVVRLEDSEGGRSIADLIVEISNELPNEMLRELEFKLQQVGVFDPHRYGNDSWRLVDELVHAVDEDFPAIRSSKLSPSITSVQYRINVGDLSGFVCGEDQIWNVMVDRHDSD